MGRAIIRLAELHESTGADLTELFAALDLLSASLDAKQKAETLLFADDTFISEEEIARLDVLIKKFDGMVDNYTAEYDDL